MSEWNSRPTPSGPLPTTDAKRLITTAVALGAVLAAIAGCGGGAAPSRIGTGSPAPNSERSKAPSREFMKNGRDNRWASFGEVAYGAEREAASKVLAKNLNARQSGEWEAQCSSPLRKTIRELAPTPGGQPLVVRKNHLRGAIDVLRVKGNRGIALIHGTDGTDYAMSMGMESGKWKVSANLTEKIS